MAKSDHPDRGILGTTNASVRRHMGFPANPTPHSYGDHPEVGLALGHLIPTPGHIRKGWVAGPFKGPIPISFQRFGITPPPLIRNSMSHHPALNIPLLHDSVLPSNPIPWRLPTQASATAQAVLNNAPAVRSTVARIQNAIKTLTG
jgi:hypothetical protein